MALGDNAVGNAQHPSYNIAIGSSALSASTSANLSNNISIGYFSGQRFLQGSENIFIGPWGGATLTSGNGNTIIGRSDYLPYSQLSNTLILGASGLNARFISDSIGHAYIGSNLTATGITLNDPTASTVNVVGTLSVNSTTGGMLPPRMTTTQRNAIANPAEGLLVYDTTLHKLYCFDGTTWQAAW